MQESAFLAAIRADPSDRLARLAYADWLEERGDPRAELIRIEEEMRPLPAFADRFWELKPRRNEFRAASPADWLAELGYGTVIEPMFRHGVPDGWRERWRLIREFTERWHRIPMPDIGGRLGEIREAEERLGRTLPPPLREYAAFAFDARREHVSEVEDYHDVLHDSYEMRDIEGLPALSLLFKAERDYRWAVMNRDLGEGDPPVSGFHKGNETFVPDADNPVAPTVTSFVLNYAMRHVYAQGGGLGTPIPDKELIRRLEAIYPIRSHFDTTRTFEADELPIRLTPDDAGWPRFDIEVARPMAREAIPQFIWDLTSRTGSYHGMFRREPRRR